MKRLLVLLAAAVAMLPAFPASARVPDKTPRRLLEAEVRRTLADRTVTGSTPGIVVERGGRTILGINATLPLAPASLLKLATTTVALERFGPDHRFVTRVVGAVTAGAGAARSLTLVGGGDPTLATAAYRAERFIGKPKPDDPHPIPVFAHGSPTVEELASGIAAAGVRSVIGDILVDDTIFDAERTQPGWLPEYLHGEPDTGYIDGLTVNEGFSDPQGTGILASPALSAGQALRAALVRRGISVGGGVRFGVAPQGTRTLASVSSPPLADIVFYTNHWSVNYAAEMLFKDLGGAFAGAGTSAGGGRIVASTLGRLGIPLAGFRQFDGSGLSVLDRITPATIGAILDHMLQRKGATGDAMRASLPVAGEPGTLWKRMRGTQAAGNLRGKTGTIRGVRALAGWVTPQDGVPIVYVLLFNNVNRPSTFTSPLDFLGISMTRYPTP